MVFMRSIEFPISTHVHLITMGYGSAIFISLIVNLEELCEIGLYLTPNSISFTLYVRILRCYTLNM